MKAFRFGIACALAMFLAACGGGDSGGSNPPPPPSPPSGLSYPSPHTFTIGTAITALTPTVTGAPAGYSVAPALPAGLALNATSGVISGTPTAPQAATNHTVTASNAGGNTTAIVSITVNDLAPSIGYARATYSFTTELPVAAVTPSATGGAVVTWSISPALPAGLTFSATTGAIAGTPTAQSAATSYVVTAVNSGGSDTFDLSIAVQSAVLFDLGHNSVAFVEYEGSRILSQDATRALLWNAQTKERIFDIETHCPLACGGIAGMRGQTVYVRTPAGYDVYSAATGTRTAHIDVAVSTGQKWTVATDGSYVVLFDGERLSIWSSSGASLVTRTGNYSNAIVFPAPGELRVGRGPTGDNVIETIAVPSGAVTYSPVFNGTFHSWFDDGERFFTTVANTALIFSKLAGQEDIAALGLQAGQNLAGHGNWFWTTANVNFQYRELRIYAVGASSTPAATFQSQYGQPVVPSNDFLAMLPLVNDRFAIIDLTGAVPVKTVPSSPVYDVSTFAALSATDWVVGSESGAVVGGIGAGTPKIYAYGQAASVAASPQRLSVATTSGAILNFDLASRTLENEILFPSSKIRLSANGSVLGAQATTIRLASDRTLRAYSLPSRNVIAEWPATVTQPGDMEPIDFDMSAGGDVFGQRLVEFGVSTSPLYRRVFRIDGTPIWSYSSTAIRPYTTELVIAPLGTQFATSTSSQISSAATNIYTNGVLSSAALGEVIGWLDDTRLLVKRYEYDNRTGFDLYAGSQIINTSGQTLASPPLAELYEFQIAGPDLIYTRGNLIINALTGDTVWSSPNVGLGGAVNADYVFFVSGHSLRAEPR